MPRTIYAIATVLIAGACSTVDLPPSRATAGAGGDTPSTGGMGGAEGGDGGATASSGGMGGGGGGIVLEPNGTPCDAPEVCTSGLCVDGFCCDAACEGACQRCDAAASVGTCTPEATASSCPDGLCDGAGTCTAGNPTRLLGFPGAQGDDTGLDSAVDAAGNLLLAGQFSSPVDFGAGPITIGANPTAALVKLDPQGNLEWSHTLGDDGECYVRGVAVGPGNGVFVAGNLAGTMTVGGAAFDTGTDGAAFVLAFDDDGNLQWSWLAETDSALSQQFLAVGANGAVTVTGAISGQVDFGQGLVDVGARVTTYVARLDPTGQLQWVDVAVLGPGNANDGTVPMGIAVSGDSAFVTGWFSADSTTLGGTQTLTRAKQGTFGGSDAFIARYDGQGSVPWAKRFGDQLSQIGEGVAVDPDGNLWVSGSFNGAIDLGGGELPNLSDTGTTIVGLDIYLAKLDAQGNHLFSTVLGPMEEYGFYHARVATDPAGNVVVGGRMGASVDMAGLGEVSGDYFVHKRASDGTPLWARGFPGVGLDEWTGNHLSTGPDGEIVFFGNTSTSVDVGLGSPFTTSGGEDALLLILQP